MGNNKHSRKRTGADDSKEIASPQPPEVNTPNKKKTKTKPPHEPSSTTTTPNFQTLDLPVAEFSCYDEATNSNISTTPQAIKEPPTSPKAPSAPKPLPIPHSTPEGLRWQNACLKTRQHPRYPSTYDFTKFQTLTAKYNPSATWVTSKPSGESCTNNPHAIALDFEMCETKCPRTGRINPKALCRMSVIDASKPDVVLLDTLVKPEWPVTDYRTRINGIEAAHLENVRFTMAHAQAFMLALCSEETVIIGHGINNDLAALQMVHHCVVDSACLFSIKDEPNATPSLKDVSMAVLKREMPTTHDSVNDARVTLLCIEEGYMAKEEAGEDVELIVRHYPRRNNTGRMALFVHRVPKGCEPRQIRDLFLTHSHVKPKEVPDIEFGKGTGKVTVKFTSVDHANLAFQALGGEAVADMTGRLQKKVYLQNRKYVQVRMMSMQY